MKKAVDIRIIGLVILVFLLYRVDLHNILEILKQTHPGLICGAFFFMVVHSLIKFIRYQYILSQQSVDCPFAKTVQISLASIYLSFITPGRMGEFAKAFFIQKQHASSMNKLFAGSVLDRLYDVYILLITALVGISFVVNPFGSETMPLILSLCALVLAPISLFIPQVRLQFLSTICWIPEKLFKTRSLYDQLNGFFQELDHLMNWELLSGLILTIIAYIIFFYSCNLMSLSVGIPLPYYKVAFFVACVNIASFLPISFAGLGTREACLVYFFAREGLTSESALAFSALIFILTYILFGALGFCCLIALRQKESPFC